MKYFHHPIDVGCKYRQNYLIFKQISRKKTLSAIASYRGVMPQNNSKKTRAPHLIWRPCF